MPSTSANGRCSRGGKLLRSTRIHLKMSCIVRDSCATPYFPCRITGRFRSPDHSGCPQGYVTLPILIGTSVEHDRHSWIKWDAAWAVWGETEARGWSSPRLAFVKETSRGRRGSGKPGVPRYWQWQPRNLPTRFCLPMGPAAAEHQQQVLRPCLKWTVREIAILLWID